MAKENSTANSAAAKIVQSLNKNVFNRMTNLFRNVHALIKKRCPFTDFIWMCELDEIKGVDIGETYRNEKTGFSNCPHDGRASRIAGGLVDFYIY